MAKRRARDGVAPTLVLAGYMLAGCSAEPGVMLVNAPVIYGEDDRYRGVRGGRRVIFMSSEDIAERALHAGDRVDITSHFGDQKREALGFTVAEYDIPRGCAAAYFPEANVLVPVDAVAAVSNQPASKSIVITVRAASD